MLDPGTKEYLQTIGSHSLLFPYLKVVGGKIVTLILISLPFFFSSPRSRVKSSSSFKKRCSVSMMPGMSMLSGQEKSVPSAAEFTDTASAQELLPERLLAQLQLEKIENRR